MANRYLIKTRGRARDTGPLMGAAVERWHRDMAPWATLSALEIFDLVSSLPFRPDPPDIETIQRPSYTMAGIGSGGDCDDKAVALASWARLNGLPYRFVATRRPNRKTLHHVHPDIYYGGKWHQMDVTYRFNTPDRERGEVAEHLIIWQDAPPWNHGRSQLRNLSLR